MHRIFSPLRQWATRGYQGYKKIILLPHVLTKTERVAFFCCLLVAVVSGMILFFRVRGYTFVRAPASGGEYVEAIVGSPSLANPLFAVANPADLDLVRLIYAGLVRKDAEGNIVPDLAERFTVSPDQKTYTIRLRKNARWHDGEPVTANDVLFTITRIQDPEMRSPLQQSFRGVTAAKVDDATVQLTLRESFAPFVEALTIGILPEHLWRDVPAATAQLADYNVQPIGAGPFRFLSFVKDKNGVIKSYTLERATSFHGITPYLKRLTFKFYPTFDTAKEALVKGEVQGIHVIPKQLKEKIPEGPYRFAQLTFPQYTAVFLNQEKNPALKDKRVRQALMAAIDRESITREALRGEATLIASPILPGAIGALPSPTPPAFNVKKAGALLTEAGWKTITKEEYVQSVRDARNNEQKEAKTGTPKNVEGKTADLREVERDVKPEQTTPEEGPEEFPLNAYRIKGGALLTIRLTTIDHPENKEVARIIKEGWEAVGIRVVTDIRKENFQSEVLQPRAYEALLFGVVVGRDPDPYPFWHSSQTQAPGVNIALFANREADALLEDARRTNDLGIRETKYKRFQEILAEQLPTDFLYTPTYTYLIGNALKGFAVKNIAKSDDRFANITEWHVKTRWTLRKNN